MTDLKKVTGVSTGLLSKAKGLVQLPPLKLGKHKGVIVSFKEEMTNPQQGESVPYIVVNVKVDDEPTFRRHAMFEVEFGFFLSNLARQYFPGEIVNNDDILEKCTQEPFDFWVVKNENPLDPTKPYYNWQYYSDTE